MNIAETVYQHVKIMPTPQALEVLQFIAFIEGKSSVIQPQTDANDLLNFIKTLPASTNRTDTQINQAFQSLRDEWDKT